MEFSQITRDEATFENESSKFAMIDVRYSRGVFLSGCGLWLDPQGRKPLVFISHAHSDHAGHHDRTILTPATSALMAARMGPSKGEEIQLTYGETRAFPDFSITLHPAGHVLGSAQCEITSEQDSLLYTGDFKLRVGHSSEAATTVHANTLIMETTFGRPHYVFPPTEEVIADVVRFCTQTLEDGDVPVLLGYSLGKAQEILSALTGAGLPVMLHGAVARVTSVYAELGVSFPDFQPFRAADAHGHVVICPPSVNGSAAMNKVARRRVAALTGWALDPGTIHRMRCDTAFPLSDHADYPDLLRHVEAVQPRRVLTLHGFAQDFARDLRARGIEAWALTGADQLELMFPMGKSISPRATTLETAETSTNPGPFEAFASLCASIGGSPGKLAKTRLVANALKSTPPDDLESVVTWLTGHPFSRASGRTLQVGRAVIRQALITAAGCTPSEYQAISRRFNDAGKTTAALLEAQSQPCPWTLAQVREALESLAIARTPSAKLDALTTILREQSAITARTLITILTGDLRIGLKSGLVDDAIASAFDVAPDVIRECGMLLGDPGQVAVHARAGTLESIGLEVFRPVRAMLANPEVDASAIWNRMKSRAADGPDESVWIEHKLDGIRAQIHCDGTRAEIFSRDLRRITMTFPELAKDVIDLGLNAVLDGEILAHDGISPLGFSELQKRLGRRGPDLFLQDEIPVRFVAFDVLSAHGNSVFRLPLRERRKILDGLTMGGRIVAAPVSFAADPVAIDAVFDEARADGNEGLMIKDPDSPYFPGRRGHAWVKLKKAAATLDVVVTSVEPGHGRRSHVLSDYTFSIQNGDGTLAPIGKAYSGLTDAEIAELTPEFQKWTICQRGRILDVEPRIVIEVAFDSIQASTRHTSGFSLRFPRIVRIRPDKSVAEIDTIVTVKSLASK